MMPSRFRHWAGRNARGDRVRHRAGRNAREDSVRHRAGPDAAETASVSPSFGAGNSPVDTAALPVSAQDYGAGTDDLGERIDAARGALGATCPRDLGYLEPVLPRFSDPQLEQLRTMMVTTSVDDVLAQYKAHGNTLRSGNGT